MSFDIGAVRAGLAATLGGVSGVQVYATWDDSPELPGVLISPGDPFIVRSTLANGLFDMRWRITVVVSLAETGSGQDLMDDLVALGTSSASVLGCLDAAPTWGGTVNDFLLEQVGAYSTETLGDTNVRVLRCDIDVTALVPGS